MSPTSSSCVKQAYRRSLAMRVPIEAAMKSAPLEVRIVFMDASLQVGANEECCLDVDESPKGNHELLS
jgi:hypothetical protein